MKKSISRWMILLIAAAMAFVSFDGLAHERAELSMDVVVDGMPRPEYHHGGAIYIEALRGSEYVLRLSNPTSRRVAVALSVDGLNTIDAKHTDPRSAAKWVIGPYDTIEIAGWQVSHREARRFYFTGERDSYGAALGQTDNLGVIEAVVFREKRSLIPWRRWSRSEEGEDYGASRREGKARKDATSQEAPEAALDDDYAATGMGGSTDHRVRAVDIDLEDHPAARIRIRYEFRPKLVELGVLSSAISPIDRRERAQGFESFCPVPRGH